MVGPLLKTTLFNGFIKCLKMNKTVKIAIYVAALFLVSIWMSSVIKSCNAPNDVSTTEIERTEEGLDEFEEDFFEDNLGTGEYESDMGGGTSTDSGYADEFQENYEEVDQVLENTSTSTNANTYVEKPSTKATTQYGKYMVLAGSYLIEDNAASMVRKLDKLGYSNGEVVVFNMSQYHSVCAARLSNYNEAIQISNELKRKGIDNYVHKKQ